MIELNIKYMENCIHISDDRVNVIEIYSKPLYSEIVCAFRENILLKGSNERVFMYDDIKKLDMSSKCLLITDIFFDITSSNKLMSKIYANIEDEFNFLYSPPQKNELQEDIVGAVTEVLNDSEYHFKYNTNIPIVNILKAMDIEFDNNFYKTPFENLSLIIELNEIFKADVILAVNIKCYLTTSEINEIYKLCIYKKVKLIIIENIKDYNNYSLEQKNVIDKI